MPGDVAGKTIDYYFSVGSPWAYLGSARFSDMVRRHGTRVNVMPVDYTRVFAASGGTLYENRAPQRRNYRQVELARWRRRLGIPLTLEPRFSPVDRRPASYLVIVARRRQLPVLELSHAILRAIWHEDRNIADWDTLGELADNAGFDGTALAAAARDPQVAAEYEKDTDRALARGVFGAPTYIIGDELFWGQDRLDFVEEKLMS